MQESPVENRVGPYRKTDPDTSKRAAYDNAPRSGSQRHRVLLALSIACEKGLTRDEVSEALELPDSSADGRIWELIQGAWAEDTEDERVTRHGSMAKVVVLTDKGIAWAMENL
jgi:hypothetical protein